MPVSTNVYVPPDDDGILPMTPPEAIDELLATASDFALCDGVFCAIGDVTANRIDAANEPEPCRTISLVWHSGGIIGNGGFQYLLEGNFDGDPGYRITAAAYQKIGVHDAYAAFCDAFAIFPRSEVPTDIEKRMQFYAAHPKESRESIDNRFFDTEDSRTRLLAQFIRANKVAIRRFLVKGSHR